MKRMILLLYETNDTMKLTFEISILHIAYISYHVLLICFYQRTHALALAATTKPVKHIDRRKLHSGKRAKDPSNPAGSM